MTSSHSGHEIAEAFWFRLSLKEVHLSSCLFVFIRVHSWFVFSAGVPPASFSDRLFFLVPGLVRAGSAIIVRAGRGPKHFTYLKQSAVFPCFLFHSRMIRPVVGGGGPACLRPNTRDDCCRRLRGSTLTPSFPWAYAHG